MARDEDEEDARRIADPDRLLEGEDPTTRSLEDAEHWLAAYAELLGFKNRLVHEAEAGSAELSGSSQQEADIDLSMLTGEKERLARRYRFWRMRVDELRAQ